MDAAVWFGILQAATVVVALVLLYRPLGDYIALVYGSPPRDLRIERGLYRLIGIDPASEQTWRAYARSVLAFSAVGLLLLYGLQRFQAFLPAALGLPAVPEGLAFNTAASFVANTNWQSYSPEQTMGYTVQLTGLAVQNFASAAVGLTVAIALIRGIARRGSTTIGNFWVDLVRGLGRLLLPLALISAVALLAGGVVQNFTGFTEVTTVSGGTQTLPGGPVASQEAIKLLGTNGGGFFNANSAHPFENPTGWTNLLEILLILAIPFSLPRAFGRMVGDHRQGSAIVAAMGTIFLVSTFALSALELAGRGSAPELAGAAMEGKEVRFGILGSTLFGSASTLTSTGAVNSMHDSYTALGGMMPMLNMVLGEVAPGGVGSGLYGMLVLAIIAVFVGGLLVGRTPEYLGKRIGPREIKLASLYILVVPVLVLGGTALSFAIPAVRGRRGDQHPQPRGARHERGALRVHLGGQQQRLRVRWPHGEHPVVQHGPRHRDAARPVRPHRARPGPRRLLRPGAHPGDLRHPADPQAAVRRPPRGRHRPHLLPGPHPGTARRRTRLT